jgi:hypothetical protein
MARRHAPVIIEAQASAMSPGKHTACSEKGPTMRSWPAGRSACTKIAAPISSAAAKNGSNFGSPIEVPLTWLAISTPENFKDLTRTRALQPRSEDLEEARRPDRPDAAARARPWRDLIVQIPD